MDQGESDPRIVEAASALAAAWREGTTIAAPLTGDPHATRAQAIAIQDAMAARIGGALIGWHADLAAKRACGASAGDGIVFGRIFAARSFDGPTTVPAGLFAGACVSAGFAFRLRRVIATQKSPYAGDDIASSLYLHPMLEIATSRIARGPGERAPALLDVFADNGGVSGFVFGSARIAWRELDLAAHAVALCVDGGEPVACHEPPLRGDPLALAADLLNELAPRRLIPQPGEFLAAGAVTRPVALRAGQTLTADFGRLGALKLRLT